MTEIQPPAYLQAGCYTPQDMRLIHSSLVCVEGVSSLDGGDLEVTNGAGMSVNVAAGSAFIDGDTIADQGMYHVFSDGTVNLAISASDPTDDRIDLVVATVRDSQYAGGDDDWLLQVITGTPSPVPSAPAVADNSIVLAQVLVEATETDITAGDITDVRAQYESCESTADDRQYLRAHLDSTFNLTQNSTDVLPFEVEFESVGDLFTLDTDNSVITYDGTVPVLVNIDAGVTWGGGGINAGATDVNNQILVNSTAYARSEVIAGSGSTGVQLSTLRILQPGDEISVSVGTASATALTPITAALTTYLAVCVIQ
jgi:hypothetical protein